jgi:hypothetical protein
MKPKTFVILFILLCVLASITFFVLNQEKPSLKASQMGKMLFENIPLNEIIAVQISSNEKDKVQKDKVQSVKLNKSESGWVVENLFDFPADFKSITELVDKLKKSKIGRHFEGSPDVFSRLALHDPNQPDISGDKKAIRIQLLDKDKKFLADVLVGKQRESSSGAEAHYLKPTLENTIYLVDQTFGFIGTQPRDWIDTDLLNIPSKDIETVTCIDPVDQSVIYVVKRPERDAPPELQLPIDDKSIKNRTIDSLLDSLSSLNVRDVAGYLGEISADTGFGTLPYLDFQLFDGTIYHVYPGKKVNDDQEGYYLKLEVSYVKSDNSHTESADENPGKISAETLDQVNNEPIKDSESMKIPPVETIPEEPAINSHNLNQRLSTWVYIISDWEHQSMVTDPEVFLEKMDSDLSE